MRKSMLAILPLLAGLLLAGCSTGRNPLVGTWRLTEMNGNPVPYEMIKIVTPTRFAFGRADGQGVWAGGGLVEFARDVYREIIEYHSLPRFVGCTADFSYQVDDGRWTHKGVIVYPGGKTAIDEVWERLED